MPFTVQQLIESHQEPVTVYPQETAQKAMLLMIEHDFSQLPVVSEHKKSLGIVTSDSILRALNNFGIPLAELQVSHALIKVHQFSPDDDLFDLLDDLKNTYAVLIANAEGTLINIVTSYDTTEYFRRRAEDMMYIEDIESTLKDFIRAALHIANDADKKSLTSIISEVSDADLRKKFQSGLKHYLNHTNNSHAGGFDQSLADTVFAKHFSNKETAKSLDDLTFHDYIQLLLHKSTWPQFYSVFQLKPDAVRTLLNGVRETRNALAHFHGEISSNQRDQLHFCANWLEQYRSVVLNTFQNNDDTAEPEPEQTVVAQPITETTTESVDEEIAPVEEPLLPNDSRYAPLAIWLQKQPLRQEKASLSFRQVEEIIGEELPPSARAHRSWWANDSVEHVQSQQWLDAGWRVSNISISEEKVIFTRIKEREKAYIDFYSGIMRKLKEVAQFHLREASPDGLNWILIARIPNTGQQIGFLGYSFARHGRFRVEFYIDSGDKEMNKNLFDKLSTRKSETQAELAGIQGSLEWERIDDKRASRIALYNPGSITDKPEKLVQLQKWAIDAMIEFQRVMDHYVHEVTSM